MVQIGGRIISPDTGEVLAVAQGAGKAHRKDVTTGYSSAGIIAIMGGAGAANDPVMHEATDQAVKNIAQQLEQNLAKLPPRSISIDGLVAASEASGHLILNVGSRTGTEVVKPGDKVRSFPKP
ncbi:MAG: CsgG/HfaB family protein [Acidobacteriota bacterium]|nr:CsgG/HfaB family protein [Acidobacteriota bacterium]